MTGRLHPDLRRLALAAEVTSPGSFSILGRRIDPGADDLLPALESELYRRLYCGSAESRASQAEDPAESTAFIAALSRANTGAGTWEPGWKIGGEQDVSTVTAIRDGVTFWVERSQVRTSSGNMAPGEECSVRIGKEMRHLLYGFYLALGNEYPGDGGRGTVPLSRLYWHLTPNAAVRYVQAATALLNGAGIPFQTKVVSNPRQYVRSDSGVLYLRKADFERAAPVIGEIYQSVSSGLRPAAPLFTKPLAAGLSLAEDPGNGMSFGQSRCRAAALGLWRCHTEGLTELDPRLGAIAETFRAEGIDPEFPYLQPGSADRYDLNLESGEGG